jgi:hypothetical protein
VQIRLLGNEEEVTAAAEAIRQAFNVAAEHGPYDNRRGEGVRLYLTVATKQDPEGEHEQTTRPSEG